ncbi:hypothetical protein Yalta_042 [Yalta virus]|nr:hypothetical protein Yalta_042 [Yalta virus]
MAIKQIYFVEGNIGAGKSTLLKALSKDDKYNIIDEPMDLFCKLKDYNPLEMFYKKTMSGFQFSTYIMYIFLDIIHNKLDDNKINIICRSIFSSVYVFANQSLELGLMSQIDYDILSEFIKLYTTMLEDYDVSIIYLDADSSTCHERLIKRNRKEENEVPLSYLKKIESKYENYINNINEYPLFRINSERNMEDIKEFFEDALKHPLINESKC